MMDHNAMDHGGMDHGGMGDGGDMDMCSMSMLFTWNTKNLCLVFDWWHVRTSFGLVLTLLTVVALGMGYEYIRQIARIYDARCASLAGTFFFSLFLAFYSSFYIYTSLPTISRVYEILVSLLFPFVYIKGY